MQLNVKVFKLQQPGLALGSCQMTCLLISGRLSFQICRIHPYRRIWYFMIFQYISSERQLQDDDDDDEKAVDQHGTMVVNDADVQTSQK